VKAKDLIRRLEANGWVEVRRKGSHRQYKHSDNPNLITVPDHAGVDLKPGTLNSILKKAGLMKS
jgi:predicted RNA binding protein YcfA (HicA-like mRNA interferase family)